MKKILYTTLLLFPLTGCSIFDDIGRHMPVIGERCENWQCFTSDGQAQSEAKKRAINVRQDGSYKRKPINAAQSQQQTPPTTETPELSPPAADKPLTPFDMSPEQLGGMRDPYGAQE